ncbi:uncharacterized protein H6S33_006530 [Morchella sextelata]|uniref:uncharacterized protein n=1 Tax=Morchella sextelata TaxID=1174677 RepID=UPI001D04CBAF|nr:uncharacterized protein H6S33_006530 [Morchella sextelata]KAH0604862.1 hypothetical protein H6S33_006530 [Morchella sextelata]
MNSSSTTRTDAGKDLESGTRKPVSLQAIQMAPTGVRTSQSTEKIPAECKVMVIMEAPHKILEVRNTELSVQGPSTAQTPLLPEPSPSITIRRPVSPTDEFLMRQRTSLPPGMVTLMGSMGTLLKDHFEPECFHEEHYGPFYNKFHELYIKKHQPLKMRMEDVVEITLMTRLPNGSIRSYRSGEIPVSMSLTIFWNRDCKVRGAKVTLSERFTKWQTI